MADGYFDKITTSAGLTCPDPGIGTDLDVRVDALVDDWDGSAGTTYLVAQLQAAGTNEAWGLQIRTGGSGLVRLYWTENGSTYKFATSSVGTGITDGTRAQVRVTLDVDVGGTTHEVKFYKRTDTSLALTDNTGWTQIGTTQADAGGGTTSIFNSTLAMSLGAHSAGGLDITGQIYQGLLLNGINGAALADPDFRTGDWSDLGSGHADSAGNTWTATGTITTDWDYVSGSQTITPTLVNQTATTLDPTFSFSQSARPASDITTTGWTASTGPDLYAMLDEATPSDSDYITATAT